MTPERWLQIKAVLDTALDLPDHDRLSYLTRACGPDTSLRREVESLLEAHGRGDVVIEDLAVAFPGAAFAGATEFALSGAADDTYSAHPSHESTERQIGAYRVVREIGHGGMGTVFLAARADEAFRRQVAIKLVSRGPISDDAVQRFQSERQILADLDHPNIARLLDGGTTDDGAPYLVMEYVEGQTITEYCDARSLRTTDRLNLFRDVCAAVEYAHRRRVVHRDIKPGNILVTPDGVPKLLDFGIAKILSPNDGDGQSHQTVQLLTPDYASPEQMTGKPITVTSDIYSLGVLLYELLSGHRPYRVDSRIPTALARAICDEQPEAPSTAIARVEDVPSTTGAGMVRLTPERVSGTRDNPPEKLRRRLAGDLDRIVLMALRKQPERRYRSVEQFSDDIARHMSGLPVVARHDSLVYRGGKFAARHPLATAAALLLTVATLFGAAAFFGTIDVRALGIRAGDVLSRPALAFAKRDWLAIADFDNRTKEDLFDSSLNTALAVSLEQSTYVNVFPRRNMEASLRRMKKPDDTRVDARLAREIAQREGVKLVLAPSIGEVGGVYLLSAALVDPVRGTALRAESARAHSRREIFDALDNLTQQIRADLGEVSSSIASEAKPLSQVTTSSLDALKMFSLGQQRARAGKFDEARALYERALEIDPRFTAARGSLGMIEFEFVDRKAGRDLLTQAVAEADNLTDVEQYTSKAFYATIVENDLPKAVDAWRALLALYPDVGTAHNNLGRVYLLMKRYEDASSAFSKAIELDPYLMPSYFNLEEIYLEHEGDPEAALELCKKQLMYNDQDVWAYVHSGEAYLGLDRLEDAREAFEHALALGPAYVDVLKPLGSTYRLLGRYQDALRTFRRVQEVDERQVVADYDAGIVYSLIGDEAEARRSFDRFRRSTERLAANGPRDARYVFDLALVWSRLGDRTRGWSLAQTASGLDRTHYYDLARVLAVQGRTGPALRMLDLAVKEGFRDIIRMKIDPDLASLAKTPNFQELVATRHHPPPSREPRPF